MIQYINLTIRGYCHKCNKKSLFLNRFKLNELCRNCGLVFQDNDDGIWFFLLLVDRAFFIFPLVVLMYFGFKPVYFIPTAIFLIILFIYATPFRMGLSVALDYYFKSRSSK